MVTIFQQSDIRAQYICHSLENDIEADELSLIARQAERTILTFMKNNGPPL